MSRSRSITARIIAKPITVFMIFLSLIGTGIIAYFKIPINLLPDGFSARHITIWIPIPDSSPAENEDDITKPVEEIIRSIPGVLGITTFSGEFGSQINVEFGPKTDMDMAYSEIKDRVERIKHNFPDRVDRYYCFRFNLSTDLPIVGFAALYEESLENPFFLAEEIIKTRLEGVDGVARVEVEGIVDDAIRVFLDPAKVEGHKVDLYRLITSMATDNFIVPAGRITDGTRRCSLRIDSKYKTLAEVEEISVDGSLKIKDIGEVVLGRTYRSNVFRVNGKEALAFWMSKESQKNTAEVCGGIEQEIEELKKDPRLAGFEFITFFNQKEIIESSLDTLKSSMTWGGILAFLVLLAFLRHARATLIVAMAIPTSILIALVVFYFTDHTINIISLSGFTLAVGMLVDNAIVVKENIFRFRAQGLDPAEAAARGAAEIGTAILMATLTTIVVFLPMIFLPEDKDVKLILGEIGLPISFSLLASLLTALAFIPLAATLLLRGRKGGDESAAAFLKTYNRQGRMAMIYEKGIRWALTHRLTAMVIAFCLFATTFEANKHVESAMDGGGGDSGVSVRVDLPDNYTLVEANDVFRKLETFFQEKFEEYKIDVYFCNFDERNGRFVCYLRDDADFQFIKSMPKRLGKELPKLPGVRYDLGLEGGDSERRDFRIEISGPDSRQLADIIFDIKERLLLIPEITNVRTDIEKGRDEVHIDVDRELAEKFQVNPAVLRGTVAWGLGGQRLPDFDDEGREVRMQVEYEEIPVESLDVIRRLGITTNTGARVPLASLAKLSVGRGPAMIVRRDGRTSMGITVTPLADNIYTISRKVSAVLEGYDFPRGYEWKQKGGIDELEEFQKVIVEALLLSLILMFILMGILFESFILPLSVLFSIPFAFTGSYWLLAITGIPMDFNAYVGFFLLAGIVVNNAIVLIDHINRLRGEGLSRIDAVSRGGRERLRPIFMTALTTISGLLPMTMPALFSSSEGTSVFSYRALAVVVLGGLALSTFFTLFVVPLTYSLFDDLGRTLRASFLGSMVKGKRKKNRTSLALPS